MTVEARKELRSNDLILKEVVLPDRLRNTKSDLRILFCFDEARILVKKVHENGRALFKITQRSLQRIRLPGFFCVMLYFWRCTQKRFR